MHFVRSFDFYPSNHYNRKLISLLTKFTLQDRVAHAFFTWAARQKFKNDFYLHPSPPQKKK
jgi:hypothetical protein